MSLKFQNYSLLCWPSTSRIIARRDVRPSIAATFASLVRRQSANRPTTVPLLSAERSNGIGMCNVLHILILKDPNVCSGRYFRRGALQIHKKSLDVRLTFVRTAQASSYVC